MHRILNIARGLFRIEENHQAKQHRVDQRKGEKAMAGDRKHFAKGASPTRQGHSQQQDSGHDQDRENTENRGHVAKNSNKLAFQLRCDQFLPLLLRHLLDLKTLFHLFPEQSVVADG